MFQSFASTKINFYNEKLVIALFNIQIYPFTKIPGLTNNIITEISVDPKSITPKKIFLIKPKLNRLNPSPAPASKSPSRRPAVGLTKNGSSLGSSCASPTGLLLASFIVIIFILISAVP
jgi:hypothetical protein